MCVCVCVVGPPEPGGGAGPDVGEVEGHLGQDEERAEERGQAGEQGSATQPLAPKRHADMPLRSLGTALL